MIAEGLLEYSIALEEKERMDTSTNPNIHFVVEIECLISMKDTLIDSIPLRTDHEGHDEYSD